jgi:asparagine synthase (glutamine-hydrolysing)
LFLRGRWRALAREISALKRERGWPALRIFRGEVLSYLVPGPARAAFRRIIGKAPDLQTSIFQSFSAGARRQLAASRSRTLGIAPDGRENRWQLMTSPHIAERAETWAQTGARHGLAFAFPLLDRRVVEFSLSLSSELFLRDGFRRRLFRDAMADVLPRSLLLRHQKYLSLPGRMIDLVDGRNDLLAQIDIYERSESVRRIINLAHVRQLVQSFPSPERVREEMRDGDNPTASVLLLAASTALTAAAYLNQHASE